MGKRGDMPRKPFQVLSKYISNNPYVQPTRVSDFRDRCFTQENLESWCRRFKMALQAKAIDFREAIAQAKQSPEYKYRRYRPTQHLSEQKSDPAWSDAKFSFASILYVQDEQHQYELILLSPMIAAEAGSYGVIKIGFVIDESSAKFCVNFHKPRAVKVLHNALMPAELYFSRQHWTKLSGEPIASCQRKAADYSKQYLVLPLIRGCDLAYFIDLYASTEPLSLTSSPALNFCQRLKLSLAIIDALEKLHALNIVHFDLKPQNVIICSEGNDTYHATIVDLDKVKHRGESVQSANNGTGDYYLPELSKHNKTKGGLRADFANDIFTLGVTFAEIFVGRGDVKRNRPGITVTRRRYIEAQSMHDDIAKYWLKFDEILPDVDCLDKFLWSGFYFKGKMQEIFYMPLCELLKKMMSPVPDSRPSLTEVGKKVKLILESVERSIYRLDQRCQHVSPAIPFAEPVVVMKASENSLACDLTEATTESRTPSPFGSETSSTVSGCSGIFRSKDRTCTIL